MPLGGESKGSEDFAVGAAVWVSFRDRAGRAHKHAATVASVASADGSSSYRVAYDDGDTEDGVGAECLSYRQAESAHADAMGDTKKQRRSSRASRSSKEGPRSPRSPRRDGGQHAGSSPSADAGAVDRAALPIDRARFDVGARVIVTHRGRTFEHHFPATVRAIAEVSSDAVSHKDRLPYQL